jgi:hypothetical protein
MKQYEFDFSALSVGEASALWDATESGDIHRTCLIMDKFVVGGLLQLPLLEMVNVINQFNVALGEYLAPVNYDDDTVNRLLRQALKTSELFDALDTFDNVLGDDSEDDNQQG